MGERAYDLIVVGAGIAGVAAATKVASSGCNVAIVDALPYGGTCALRGCDPKKTRRRGAEILDAARLMRGRGIDEGGLNIDWSSLMAHKRGFTGPASPGMERRLVRAGVATLTAGRGSPVRRSWKSTSVPIRRGTSLSLLRMSRSGHGT
ncbi:FAD-dependent oxidoreductase [Agromyces sp. NPDC049794]|uniref:FAD-dependent oxidoreductase n=1 Tax=unclassified Agromyces TaxID=2639701 RepID=UPI0033EC254B